MLSELLMQGKYNTGLHMKLTDAQNKNMQWLIKRGGSGIIDRYGRVLAEGETAPQGSFPSWLKLIANGLITGEAGRLTVTDLGRRHIALNK